MTKSIKYGLVMILVSILLAISCKKGTPPPDLPQTYINIFIYPNTLDYIPDGGFVYLTADPPSRGVIVYRAFRDEFKAYERTCPYDPYDCCDENLTNCSRLYVEQNSLVVIDSCCMSRYLLTDGSPFEGPSPYSLKEYNTSYDGDVLHIFN